MARNRGSRCGGRVRVLASVLAISLFAALSPMAIAGPDGEKWAVRPGTFTRHMTVDGRERSYLVHVPPAYDPKQPTPVVLAFHGAYMNAPVMAAFCGLNGKSDSAGFIVVYPNGLGFGQAMLFFNAFSEPRGDRVDDVKFTAKLLDDLETAIHVDPNRIFATGMSNGGMMCQRLGAELSDRIAAIAPVSGTIALPTFVATHPIPVLEFHGTADGIVPWRGNDNGKPQLLHFQSVDATIQTWVNVDGCLPGPTVERLPSVAGDATSVSVTRYAPGKSGCDVVLVTITGGGHTWPGRPAPVNLLGLSTRTVSANDMIWDFFQRHPKK